MTGSVANHCWLAPETCTWLWNQFLEVFSCLYLLICKKLPICILTIKLLNLYNSQYIDIICDPINFVYFSKYRYNTQSKESVIICWHSIHDLIHCTTWQWMRLSANGLLSKSICLPDFFRFEQSVLKDCLKYNFPIISSLYFSKV